MIGWIIGWGGLIKVVMGRMGVFVCGFLLRDKWVYRCYRMVVLFDVSVSLYVV